MKSTLGIVFVATIVAVSSAAHVQNMSAAMPEIFARHHVMEFIGSHMRVLSQQASGKLPFSKEETRTSSNAIAVVALTIPYLFPDESIVGQSTDAMDSILMNRDDFTSKANDLWMAATALSEVADVEQLKAGLGPVGQTCRSCHSAYRK